MYSASGRYICKVVARAKAKGIMPRVDTAVQRLALYGT